MKILVLMKEKLFKNDFVICYKKHFNAHLISLIKSTTKPTKISIRRILMKQQYYDIQ